MIDRWRPLDLRGTVAVVTGASRGGGRGISAVLGQSHCTVYVTGRSTRNGKRTRSFPWTIDETADLVRERGGEAVAVRCDHTDAHQVKRLFDRIRKEQGRLDLLVNNVWGGYERNEAGLPEGDFWEQPLWQWDAMFEAGLRAHLLSSYYAIPLMLPQHRGLIVNTIAWDRGKYLHQVFYDLAKQSIRRLAYDLSIELRPKGITSIALAPGFMRSELVMEAYRKHPEAFESPPFDIPHTESTEYIGRAVACLAADPHVLRRSGSVLNVGDLARAYDFTDTDGRLIAPWKMPTQMERD